jgi:hypothetical protein
MPAMAIDKSTQRKQIPRCPACGQPIETLVRGRCSLCDFQIEDEPVTADDATPFAQNEARSRREWWAMTKWMWTAGAGRLSHLSLMRVSPAARNYARRSLMAIAITAAVCWLVLTGWHAVTMLPVEAGGEPPEPSGKGWVNLARMPAETVPPANNPSRVIAWWWHPALALTGAVGALVAGLLLGWLLLGILRRGVERALLPQYRGQHRLSAALCYSMAWATPLVPAGLVLALLPLCRLAQVGEWWVRPPTAIAYGPAAVVAGLAVVMLWFGLTRLALTVPVRTRTRVVLFCGVGMPLIAVAMIVGSIWGLWLLQSKAIADWLQLQW